MQRVRVQIESENPEQDLKTITAQQTMLDDRMQEVERQIQLQDAERARIVLESAKYEHALRELVSERADLAR